MSTTIKGTSPHADFYPMLSDEALAELAEDIKQNGQRDPITINADGILLDGRNRLAACNLLGIDPIIEVYDGDDDGAFVRSRNERRHQATGSRAMSTALSMVEDDLRGDGRWKRGAVITESGNSDWRNRLNEAGQVLDYAADLADDVVSGKIALDAAYRQAKAEKDRLDNLERERVELARRQEQEEDAAREFFATNNDAGVWLAARPGQHKTLYAAFKQYEAENEEVRLAEERKRRAAEEERRATQDRIERMGRYLEAFLSSFQTGLDMADHPEREQILATLTPQKRADFERIETTYLNGPK